MKLSSNLILGYVKLLIIWNLEIHECSKKNRDIKEITMSSFTSLQLSDASSSASSTILRSLENTEHLSINDIESLLIATLGVIEGTDTDDCNYDSIKE